MVGFAFENFTGSESSKFIEVMVKLNGTSNSPVDVTVTPTIQSPVSASGKGYINSILTCDS